MSQLERIEAIHVYPVGETHVSDMDCVCEPVAKAWVEHASIEGGSIPVIVHGSSIAVCVQVKARAAEAEDEDA